jgi:hypothetical protein
MIHSNLHKWYGIPFRHYSHVAMFSNRAEEIGVESVSVDRFLELGVPKALTLKLASSQWEYELRVRRDGEMLLGQYRLGEKREKLYEGACEPKEEWKRLLGALKESESGRRRVA